jgi:hypothetical protein
MGMNCIAETKGEQGSVSLLRTKSTYEKTMHYIHWSQTAINSEWTVHRMTKKLVLGNMFRPLLQARPCCVEWPETLDVLLYGVDHYQEQAGYLKQAERFPLDTRALTEAWYRA